MKQNKEDRVLEKFWIIYSKRKNAIWQAPFQTYRDAKEEYDKQIARLTQEIRNEVDWEIIEQGHFIDANQRRQKETDKQFENF